MTSAAKEFFDSIVSHENPFEYISSFVNPGDPTSEGAWLEFKEYSANPGELKNIKKEWSEVVSAFANTEGGVVVWGIKAKPTGEPKIDRACEVKLIPQPDVFAEELKKCWRDTCDPPVAGAEILPITNRNSGNKSGYVVCYIPESRFKPHLAKMAKERAFFLRNGDSCIVPSTSIIRSLFFPGRSIDLALELECESVGSPLQIKIRNNGQSSAHELAVMIEAFKGVRTISVGYQKHRLRKTDTGDKKQIIEIEHTLHPSELAPLATLPLDPSDQNCEIIVTVYSRDHEPLIARLRFAVRDFSCARVPFPLLPISLD